MARPTLAVVVAGVGMNHTIRMGCDFPVLERMGGVGQSQSRKSGQPEHAEITDSEHATRIKPPLARVKQENPGTAGLNTRNTCDGRRYPTR